MARNVNLDYSDFETLGEIKDKYPDSTLVMRKQFIDIAIQHEWNHGRPVGKQLGVCTELDPSIKKYAKEIASSMLSHLTDSATKEIEDIIQSTADELGKLHVRVTFYKEPRF